MDRNARLGPIAMETARRLKEKPVCLAVLGDLILDVAVEGEGGGIHPETEVPMLKNASTQESVGGAGNIALILSRLGAEVTIFSVVGADLPGRQLVETQARLHFDTHMVSCRGWPTPKKEWIYDRTAETVHLVTRIDFDRPLPAQARSDLIGEFRVHYPHNGQVLIVADHGLGVMGPETGEAITLAREAGAKVVAVPRTSLKQYQSVDVLVPNPTEMRGLVGLKGKGEAQEAAMRFAEQHGVTIFLTQGKRGLFVCSPAENLAELVPTRPVDNPQKMGARDMVLAIVSLGMALGVPLLDIAHFANAFCWLVVQQRGNATVFWSDLFQMLGIQEPVLSASGGQ